MLRFAVALAAMSLVATPVIAAPCKDAKGKFMKCPPKVTAKTTTTTTVKKAPCRDAKGRFKKC